MIKAPCKDCKDRVLHCHSTCEKYITYAEEMAELRILRRREREVTQAHVDNIKRVYKGLRRSK